MPQTQKGSWFLHYREKMDVEFEEYDLELDTLFPEDNPDNGTEESLL